MADTKKNWLSRSKATHGDGNLSSTQKPKGKKADDPIANFGNKSGGGKASTGAAKVTFAKGLMQKGK
jgi:hypothetical protein